MEINSRLYEKIADPNEIESEKMVTKFNRSKNICIFLKLPCLVKTG